MKTQRPQAGEFAKMIAGELYDASDLELLNLRHRASSLLARYNAACDDDDEELLRRKDILRLLFAQMGEYVEIVSPLHCDYGFNIHVGTEVYFNTGCVVLDCAPVRIGNHVKFGPGVHLYTATHPTDPRLRRAGLEYAKPISIGDCVWIGGGAIVLPGVRIGENSVVGAGSVVTRDLRPNLIAAGNPCRVLRTLG